MNRRFFIGSFLVPILTACTEHQVPNKGEVARMIRFQAVTNPAMQQSLTNIDENSFGSFDCEGNGVIAVCKFDIYGQNYEQIYGYSKHGWSGRSTSYLARQ